MNKKEWEQRVIHEGLYDDPLEYILENRLKNLRRSLQSSLQEQDYGYSDKLKQWKIRILRRTENIKNV